MFLYSLKSWMMYEFFVINEYYLAEFLLSSLSYGLSILLVLILTKKREEWLKSTDYVVMRCESEGKSLSTYTWTYTHRE